jgi:hypothetical protein
MTREEFLVALRTADDVFEDEPFSPWAQRIADYDADRRVLIKEQRAEIELLRSDLRNTEGVLWREGYKKECDIPACNCGPQWNHGGHAEERLREISDALPCVGGATILQRVELLKAQLATAQGEVDAWKTKVEKLINLKANIERVQVDTSGGWLKEEIKDVKELVGGWPEWKKADG